MYTKVVNLIAMLLIFSSVSSMTVLATGRQDKDGKTPEEIKSIVTKIGTGKDSKVEVRLKDGKRVTGSISEIKSDSFTVIDSTTNSTSEIAYAQVNQVKKKNTKKTLAIVGIIVGVVTVVALVAAGKN